MEESSLVNKNFIYIILFLFGCTKLFAQQEKLLDSIIQLIEYEKYEAAIDLWEKDKSQFSFTKGDAMMMVGKALENLNKEDQAIEIYKESLDFFSKNKNNEGIAESNLAIYKTIDAQENITIDSDVYFKNFIKYASKSKDPNWNARAAHHLAVKNFANDDGDVSKNFFLEAIKHYKKSKNIKKIGATYSNIGLLFLNNMKQPDSARHYFSKAIKIAKEVDDKNLQWNIYLNRGNSYKFENNYLTAIEQYMSAKQLPIKKYSLKKRLLLYSHLQECYRAMEDFKNSDLYLRSYLSTYDSINLLEQNKAIEDINTKYQTEKKEQENLQLKKEKRNLMIGAITLLVFIGSIAFLLQKNARRKRKLAEQQSLIEQQKVTTLLKEQELTSIDAMIAGQEKERQRVANELHDDLGSLMATVKLHFENIKADKEDPALKSTHQLLDKAYQKIRGIAHAKNSGVMASQGLLPAVKKMAENISSTNKIKIEVADFGLEDRMENSLELMIFRIIQELTTNIIKHANATIANIQFTQHDDSLNILIDDNGKGFDTNAIDPKKGGIGLNNIAKRIEHIEGSFTIESVLGKGASIIIDIPI